MKDRRRNPQKRKGFLLIPLGLLLIAAALFLGGYNLYDSARAGEAAGRALIGLEQFIPTEPTGESLREPVSQQTPPAGVKEIVIPDYILNPNMEMPVKSLDGVDYIGILQIPALELELPVVSQWSYPDLKIAPCRYSGSAYQNNLVIAGHNYASHFGTIKNLEEGDAVIFTDMDGNRFTYRVVEQEILRPSATEEMEAGDWNLTLFTCTVGAQNRVTVRCELENG